MPSHVPLKSVLAGGPSLAAAVLACGPWFAGVLARGPGLAAAVLVDGAGLEIRGAAAAGAELEAGVEARALLGDDVRAGPGGALLGDGVRAVPDGALDGVPPVAGGAGAPGAAVGCAVG
jgi:hypothetical protein